MTLAAKPFAAAVNHLLARESWARERLAPYAGKTARLSCPPVVLTLLVQPDGYLGVVGETETHQFDVTVSVPSDALPAFVQGGQAAVMKHVKIEGDAEFATVIAKLAEHLRWEPEEDLAKLIGDGPAWRWQRVQGLLADHHRPDQHDDNLTVDLWNYCSHRDQAPIHEAEPNPHSSPLSAAHAIHLEDGPRRWEIKARLLAGMGAADIAKRLGLEKGAHGVAGILAWPGRYSRHLDRVLPIATDGRADGHDGALSRHEARYRANGADGAGVGKRNGGAFEIGDLQLVGTGARDDIVIRRDELGKGHAVGMFDVGDFERA